MGRKTMMTLMMCVLSGSALAQPLTNGDFSDGLSHWTVVASGGSAPGEVVLVEGGAELREGGSFVVSLEQSMVLEQALASVSFTIDTTPGFDAGEDFIPDAFEATLMRDDGLPALEGWRPTTTAFFSLQEDGTAHTAPGVTFDGTTVTADLSPIKVGTTVVLSFALVGGDKDVTSAVRVGDVVVVLANQPPVADAGDDTVIECGATLTLDGSESSDPDGDTLVAAWTDSAGESVGDQLTVSLTAALGAETYTLTVDDGHGEADSDDVQITVVDTTAPVLPELVDQTISAGAACDGAVPDLLADKAVAEVCGGLIVVQDPIAGAALVLGPNAITVTATDGAGNETKASIIVTLVDDTPPSFDPPR